MGYLRYRYIVTQRCNYANSTSNNELIDTLLNVNRLLYSPHDVKLITRQVGFGSRLVEQKYNRFMDVLSLSTPFRTLQGRIYSTSSTI